jgi:hypothetical protein
MMNKIKQWLAPPIFAGEETKTQRAWFLNTTALTVSALVAPNSGSLPA